MRAASGAGFALSGEANAPSVINTRRDFDLQGLLFGVPAFSMTDFTGVF
jgi:hypothetical protein